MATRAIIFYGNSQKLHNNLPDILSVSKQLYCLDIKLICHTTRFPNNIHHISGPILSAFLELIPKIRNKDYQYQFNYTHIYNNLDMALLNLTAIDYEELEFMSLTRSINESIRQNIKQVICVPWGTSFDKWKSILLNNHIIEDGWHLTGSRGVIHGDIEYILRQLQKCQMPFHKNWFEELIQ